jgi:hypothetical protein
VEWLKVKAWSSNPSTAKKKKLLKDWGCSSGPRFMTDTRGGKKRKLN